VGRLSPGRMEREPELKEKTVRDLEFGSEEALRRFAASWGRLLRGGEIFALVGPLGAGKTVFAQALARGLGVPSRVPVTSPTFVLHRRYTGRLVMHHLDAYRLRAAEELVALDVGIFFETGAVTVIEWADKVESAVPARAVWIRFRVTGPTSRFLSVRARDESALSVETRRFVREFSE